jgi:hypothetical protein
MNAFAKAAAAAADNAVTASRVRPDGGGHGPRTPIADCSSERRATYHDYVIACGMASGEWSGKLPIEANCASF